MTLAEWIDKFRNIYCTSSMITMVLKVLSEFCHTFVDPPLNLTFDLCPWHVKKWLLHLPEAIIPNLSRKILFLRWVTCKNSHIIYLLLTNKELTPKYKTCRVSNRSWTWLRYTSQLFVVWWRDRKRPILATVQRCTDAPYVSCLHARLFDINIIDDFFLSVLYAFEEKER